MRIATHALPILVLAVSAAPAFAQPVVCHPIRRGESAAQAARRVTGDSRNMYSASFQIMNGASRFVPKSQYDFVQAGWRACVTKPAVRAAAAPRRRPDPPAVVAVAESDVAEESPTPVGAPIEPLARFRVSAQPAGAVTPHPRGNPGLTIVWVTTAIAVPWFGLHVLNGYASRRKTASVLVQHFANRFIAEFERPLHAYDEARPLKARVRRARRGRFEILLAPGVGRRYPNLTDHKRNVEYDVARVVSVLDDPAFVSGDLYTQAEWVVVPFEPRTRPKQSGVTCISSF